MARAFIFDYEKSLLRWKEKSKDSIEAKKYSDYDETIQSALYHPYKLTGQLPLH